MTEYRTLSDHVVATCAEQLPAGVTDLRAEGATVLVSPTRRHRLGDEVGDGPFGHGLVIHALDDIALTGIGEDGVRRVVAEPDAGKMACLVGARPNHLDISPAGGRLGTGSINLAGSRPSSCMAHVRAGVYVSLVAATSPHPEQWRSRPSLNLSGSRRISVDATGARLVGLNASLCNELHLLADGAHLWDTDLTRAVAERVSVRHAVLENLRAAHASLRGADLVGAVISGNLSHADLRGADLRGADLQDVSLRHADLTGALVDDATRLNDEPEYLAGATGLDDLIEPVVDPGPDPFGALALSRATTQALGDVPGLRAVAHAADESLPPAALVVEDTEEVPVLVLGLVGYDDPGEPDTGIPPQTVADWTVSVVPWLPQPPETYLRPGISVDGEISDKELDALVAYVRGVAQQVAA